MAVIKVVRVFLHQYPTTPISKKKKKSSYAWLFEYFIYYWLVIEHELGSCLQ